MTKLKNILIPTVTLTLICLFITVALGLTNDITKDKIAELNWQKKVESMSAIFPEKGAQFLPIEEIDAEGYEVSLKGENIGFIFVTSSNGYGGPVEVMTGLTPAGNIKKVEVIACDNETPGLGASVKGNDKFLGQFLNKSEKISTEKNKEIDALTSATITTNAVINSVNDALELFSVVKGE